jgi:hypothetical protein
MWLRGACQILSRHSGARARMPEQAERKRGRRERRKWRASPETIRPASIWATGGRYSHNLLQGLWIPGSALSRRPGMTVGDVDRPSPSP